mgnify:FL=1
MKLESALKAWVARDYDGSLYMYTAKPKKMRDNWYAEKVGYVKLNDSLFPEVQWSDEEPKGIELSIKNEKSKIQSALSSLCRIALFVFILSCTVIGILHVIQWIIWQTFRT